MTADQLESGPTENKHELGGPGKEFNGEQDLSFESVAPYRNPEFGDWPAGKSGWTFEKYRD
jgi:hypothetical protein